MKNPPSTDYPENGTLRVERQIDEKIKTNRIQSSSGIDEGRLEDEKNCLPAMDRN